MQKIIQFYIRRGEKKYVASSPDVPIVTQGDTLDELAKNIEEAVALHFEDETAPTDIVPHAPVLVNFELPAYA